MSVLAPVLLPPLPGLRLDGVQADDEVITLLLTTIAATASCPCCAQSSARVHSRYQRTIRDLPCAGRAVHLRVQVRRFRCDNAACPQRIFAERLDPAIPAGGRRTDRLTAHLQRLAFVLASESAAPLLTACGMPTSPATLLRLQRRAPLPVPAAPSIVGIDEFALRKGRTYGTLIVDLERHRPIAALPDRAAATVAAWLQQYPQIRVISRDRAGAFADAATQGAPQATPVADRWHLTQNMGDVLQRVLARHPAALRQAAQAKRTGAVPTADVPPAAPASPPAEPPVRTVREARFREVLALHAQGWSVRRIALTLGLNRRTVKRYVQARALPQRGGPSRPATSTLTPYLPYLRQRWDEGCQTGTQLWHELRERGYPGSLASVYRALKHLRPGDGRTSGTPPSPGERRALSPRQALWLVVRDVDDLTAEEQRARTALLQAQATLATAATLAVRFLTVLRQRDVDALESWLQDAARSEIAELKRFATSVRRDVAAVAAALTLPWSNGQLEGQINRVKVIKRVGYGRAKFDLLQRRILCVA